MVNWKLCILCQSEKDEKLVNPMQNTRKMYDVALIYLLKRLQGFMKMV